MTFGIVLYNEARLIVGIDETAAVILGTPSVELLGSDIRAFIPQPDREHLAEARATFERYGEASGRYAVERADGSRDSITYSVLANAPMPGLNLMALAPSIAEVASDGARIRRVGNDVYVGLEVSDDELWHRTGDPALRPAPRRSPGIDMPLHLLAAVFPTEADGWAALLAVQHRIQGGVEIALSSFDGGWPRDQRSVFAARGADDRLHEVAAIMTAAVAQFGGMQISGRVT
jgi:hypothetical protein